MGLLSGNMITAIFFDIGGVLLNIHPERTLQYLSDCTDVSVDEIEKRFPMDAMMNMRKATFRIRNGL